jgi:hypothetical protein
MDRESSPVDGVSESGWTLLDASEMEKIMDSPLKPGEVNISKTRFWNFSDPKIAGETKEGVKNNDSKMIMEALAGLADRLKAVEDVVTDLECLLKERKEDASGQASE